MERVYSRTQWVDYETPIDEKNMNKLEDQLLSVVTSLETVKDDLGTAQNITQKIEGMVQGIEEQELQLRERLQALEQDILFLKSI